VVLPQGLLLALQSVSALLLNSLADTPRAGACHQHDPPFASCPLKIHESVGFRSEGEHDRGVQGCHRRNLDSPNNFYLSCSCCDEAAQLEASHTPFAFSECCPTASFCPLPANVRKVKHSHQAIHLPCTAQHSSLTLDTARYIAPSLLSRQRPGTLNSTVSGGRALCSNR